MRDLEIRGAGEFPRGREQSGHIAAVGFEMYLSMLAGKPRLSSGVEQAG
jgi:transcription-repair coupling factor (superfamily II helicase)